MTDKLPKIDLKRPFQLTRLANGGWTIEQTSASPPFSPPGTTVQAPVNLLGAYTTAEDMLLALNDVINPPPPAKELVTETPPFDLSNYPDEWMPMSYAPRTGVYVRIEDEDGNRHRPMRFRGPCWWDAPNGELRLGDTSVTDGTLRAHRWRPLSPEEDRKYNGGKPAQAPAPSWE